MISRHTVKRTQILWMTHKKVGKILVKVVKVNPKNIKVETEAGKVWNCDPAFLSETTSAESVLWGTGAAGVHFGGAPTPPPPPFVPGSSTLMLGQIVKFTPGTGYAMKYGTKHPLLVVLGSTAGKYRLAALGGYKDQYFRGITPSQVEVVEFETAGV